MASSSNLPNGTTSYSSSTTSTTTPDLVYFPDRYGYVTVTNVDPSNLLFVRTDGTAATVAGDDCYVVQPGKTEVFANASRIWYQSSRVILSGTNQFGGGNTSPNPGAPGIVTPQTSMAGDLVNPGTSVSIIGASESSGIYTAVSDVPYTVAAAG